MKYPYGISDFKKINTKNYFYCVRTDKILLLEKSDFQLFIRPRRFGKSLVLSMLENYYDVAKKDEFEALRRIKTDEMFAKYIQQVKLQSPYGFPPFHLEEGF